MTDFSDLYIGEYGNVVVHRFFFYIIIFTDKTLLYINYNFTNFTLITYNKIKLDSNCLRFLLLTSNVKLQLYNYGVSM